MKIARIEELKNTEKAASEQIFWYVETYKLFKMGLKASSEAMDAVLLRGP